MSQGELFDEPTRGWQYDDPRHPLYRPGRFDGDTIQEDPDAPVRLTGQLARVHACLAEGGWWRLDWLVDRCGGTTASVSARIRDLRKPRFGGHTIERRLVRKGLYEYQFTPKEQE